MSERKDFGIGRGLGCPIPVRRKGVWDGAACLERLIWEQKDTGIHTHHHHQLYHLSLRDAFLLKSFTCLCHLLLLMWTGQQQLSWIEHLLCDRWECQLRASWGPKGWRLFLQKPKRNGKQWEKPTWKWPPRHGPSPHQSPVMSLCCVHSRPPLLGLQWARQDHPGDLLQAHSPPHLRASKCYRHITLSLFHGWGNWGTPNKLPCFPKPGRSSLL